MNTTVLSSSATSLVTVYAHRLDRDADAAVLDAFGFHYRLGWQDAKGYGLSAARVPHSAGIGQIDTPVAVQLRRAAANLYREAVRVESRVPETPRQERILEQAAERYRAEAQDCADRAVLRAPGRPAGAPAVEAARERWSPPGPARNLRDGWYDLHDLHEQAAVVRFWRGI